MCESGLRTKRCELKSLKGGFFCVWNLVSIRLTSLFSVNLYQLTDGDMSANISRFDNVFTRIEFLKGTHRVSELCEST